MSKFGEKPKEKVRENKQQEKEIAPEKDEGAGRKVEQFFDAIEAGKVDLVKDMVKADKDLLNSRDFLGMPPLHLAVATTNLEMVKALLSLGVNVEQSDSLGATAIHYISKSASVEMAELLVQQYKANINAADFGGQTAIHTIAFSITSGSNNWPLLKWFIQHKADVAVKDEAERSVRDILAGQDQSYAAKYDELIGALSSDEID